MRLDYLWNGRQHSFLTHGSRLMFGPGNADDVRFPGHIIAIAQDGPNVLVHTSAGDFAFDATQDPHQWVIRNVLHTPYMVAGGVPVNPIDGMFTRRIPARVSSVQSDTAIVFDLSGLS